MKLSTLGLAIALMVLSVPGQNTATAPAARERVVRVLDLADGTAFARGFQHGQALKSEILEILALWRKDLKENLEVDPDAFIAKFKKAMNFEPAIRKWTPDLLDEIKGIAEGCGQPYETMFVYNCVDELWSMGLDVAGEKCTSIGVFAAGGRPTMVAQNLDIPEWSHIGPTVLRFKDRGSGHRMLIFTLPGMIALNGMSDAGVGIAVNALLHLAPSRDGLPVAFVIRGALAAGKRAEALSFLAKVPHAAGQNYMIGGAEGVSSTECSANKKIGLCCNACGAEVNIPCPSLPWRVIWHTNHPLGSDDWHPRYLASLEKTGKKDQIGAFVCPRTAVLKARIAKKGNLTVDEVKAALSLHEGPGRVISSPTTFGCTIMVLGEKPELHIAPGRPDRHPFITVRFE